MKNVTVIGKNGRSVSGVLVGDVVTIDEDIKKPLDMDAGRKFYTQLDNLLRSGRTITSVRPRDFTDINLRTVHYRLREVRAVYNKREIGVTSASVIRRAKKYSALRVLAELI